MRQVFSYKSRIFNTRQSTFPGTNCNCILFAVRTQFINNIILCSRANLNDVVSIFVILNFVNEFLNLYAYIIAVFIHIFNFIFNLIGFGVWIYSWYQTSDFWFQVKALNRAVPWSDFHVKTVPLLTFTHIRIHRPILTRNSKIRRYGFSQQFLNTEIIFPKFLLAFILQLLFCCPFLRGDVDCASFSSHSDCRSWCANKWIRYLVEHQKQPNLAQNPRNPLIT